MKYSLIFLLLGYLLTAAVRADDPGLPGEDPDVPLDGGVTFLMLAGAVYGVKWIRDRNKGPD